MIKFTLVFFMGVFCLNVSGAPEPTAKVSGSPLSEGYEGAQVLRISIKSNDDNTKLENLKKLVYIEELRRTQSYVDILVKASTLKGTKDALQSSKLEFKVTTANLQKHIDAAKAERTGDTQLLQSHKGHGFTFTNYHSLKTMYQYLDYLVRTFGSFVSMRVIGKTLEGREIKVLKISCGKKDAPSIWIDGGHHAREWVTYPAALYIVSQLVEHRDTLPPKMKEFNYYVVPCMNPDGYEYTRLNDSTRLWRKNRRPGNKCVGVDINRNYDDHWGGTGSSVDECAPTYQGPSPNSELEIQAITNFLSKRARRFKGLLSIHSYGQQILYAYSYAQVFPSNKKELHGLGEIAAKAILKTTGGNYTVGTTATLLYAASGVSIDWAIDKGIRYPYIIELRDTGARRFVLPPSEILPCCKEAFEMARVIAQAP